MDIFAQFDAGTLGLVQAADLLEKEFFAANLMYKMTIHHRLVGWDPSNRDGEGGNPLEVLLLASDLALIGWSWEMCDHATCAEVQPGDKEVEAFNKKLCADTGLAPVVEDSIRFGSIAAGHTNQALRAIDAGVPSNCPLLSENGFLSLSKLEKRDKQYAEAVKGGLRWKVLCWAVRVLYPRALDIIQAGAWYVRT